MKPILYLQSDPKWANHDYSAIGEKTNIKAEGCGITCTAMIIASLIDNKVTPITTADWSKSKGYKAPHQGTYYSYFKPQGNVYGLKITQIAGGNAYHNPNANCHKVALEAVKKGNWVIACMGKGNWTTSGHYVLWYDVNGSKVLINDPWSTKTAQTNAEYSLFKNEVKYYWIVEVPDKFKEEEEDMARYNKLTEVPTWAKDMIKDMQDVGCFSNKDKMDISDDMIRTIALITRYNEKKK